MSLLTCRGRALLVTLAWLTPALTSAQRPRGTLVLLGGEPGGEVIDAQFVRLARAAGSGPIVIIPMAGAPGAQDAGRRERIFRALGAETVVLQFTREGAGSDSVAAVLSQASGIWFTGGRPGRLADVLLGTRALDSVRARYRAGAVVGGSSAGAMVMSDLIITGEERRPGGRRGPDSTGRVSTTLERDNVVTAQGFGLLPNTVIGTHFLRRLLHNRLLSPVLEHPQHIGLGIDEETALVVHPDGIWEVMGESQVIIFDARGARVDGKPLLGAQDIRVDVLTPGMRWSPAARAARSGSGRSGSAPTGRASGDRPAERRRDLQVPER